MRISDWSSDVCSSDLRQGRTDAQIKRFLTDRYGEFVLLTPAFNAGNLILWSGPFLVVGLGGLLLFRRLRSPSGEDDPATDLSPEEERRVQRQPETDSA